MTESAPTPRGIRRWSAAPTPTGSPGPTTPPATDSPKPITTPPGLPATTPPPTTPTRCPALPPTNPTTLTSTTATGPKAALDTASYTYDAAGNTTTITGGALGNQTLTWTDQDTLATDVTSAGTSSYVYDAAGNLLLRRDPGQTTLFLGDQQLVLNTTTGATSGTRYYTLGGVTLAARSSTGEVDYLVPNRQGTDTLTLTAATYAVATRQYLPFGQTPRHLLLILAG